ncbi:hypothetical protein [Brevundimonas aveniformis]|uniref:hypothetical protein n=1 Tax=Brevundimonas aveniformis TaxID=370977 RepID=UPI002490E725|nr:hypothetical protein [Brevundimonas aveniformis]
MTLTSSKWRSDLYWLAENFAEESADLHHHRPAEEIVEALPFAFQCLTATLATNGFTKQQIQDALVAANQGLAESPDFNEPRRGAEAAKARKAASRSWLGQVAGGANSAGGLVALFGIVGVFVTLVVTAFDGPARLLAWISIALILGGLCLALLANGAMDSLVKDRLRKTRQAGQGSGE